MTAPETSDYKQVLEDGEIPQYLTRWSRMPLFWWNLITIPLYVVGVPILLDYETRFTGYAFLATAVLISCFSYAAWMGRSVIVSNRRIIYHAALTQSVSAIPLDKIEHVAQATGRVIVRGGTVFNTLTLDVPNAAALASAVETARVTLSTEPRVVGSALLGTPRADTKKKDKTPSKSDSITAWSLLWVIGLGIVLYFLPAPDPYRPARISAAPRPAPAAPTEAPTPTLSPIVTRVSNSINTSVLMDCWMSVIRGAPGWISNRNRRGDTLARMYRRGGIVVIVVVVGNRIDLQRLELAGVTGGDGQTIQPDASGAPGRLGYWEAQDIYTTAVRAITRCGIAEVPLPNGVFHFIFDPNRDDIPVIPVED